MKVIITGATGFIGGEVVYQCINNPRVEQVIVLSRRELPDELRKSSKVTTIIQSDFSVYSQELLDQLAGAEACIWTLGMKRTRGLDPKVVDLGYTMAAVKAFEAHLAPRLPKGKKFRFLFTSGIFTVRDQSKSLWYLEDARKSRGACETAMHEFGAKHPSTFESYVVRAGLVLPKDWWLLYFLPKISDSTFIVVDQLAVSMIDAVVEVRPAGTIENPALVKTGKAILSSLQSKKD